MDNDIFFRSDILNKYNGEFLMIKLIDDNVYSYFYLDSFIKKNDEQPHTGQLILKYKFDDICVYNILSEYIKEIHVYDRLDYETKKILLYIGYKKYSIDKYLIQHIYSFLLDGTVKIY